MIKFITLVLSLHVGILPVDIAVNAPVARLEMHLDGAKVGERTAPPWRFRVDLGRDLVPHRLEAVAFDERGKEIERISQWVNYARRSREASLLLEPSTDGKPRSGKVIWATTDQRAPIALEVRLDNQPLSVQSDGRFELPSYDLSIPHHLQAELLFSNQQSIQAEAVFGGLGGETLTTALTAIPVVLEGAKLPPIEELEQWLQVAGEPAKIFSRDHLLSDRSTAPTSNPAGGDGYGSSIIIVRDTHIDRDLKRLLRQKRQSLFAKGGRILNPEDRVEFILTSSLPQDPRGVHRPQPVTSDFNELGLWNLFIQDYPQLTMPRQQNIWWSLALAGKRAVDLRQRRVIILLLSKKPVSLPGLSFEQAQGYLRSLRVPLLVWAPEEKTLSQLGTSPDRPYLGAPGMLQLFEDVQDLLEHQKILWIEGDHLPNEITLSAETPAGVRIAQ